MIQEENQFYSEMKLISEKINSLVDRNNFRKYLIDKGFSIWEINTIEYRIDFEKRSFRYKNKNKIL